MTNELVYANVAASADHGLRYCRICGKTIFPFQDPPRYSRRCPRNYIDEIQQQEDANIFAALRAAALR